MYVASADSNQSAHFGHTGWCCHTINDGTRLVQYLIVESQPVCYHIVSM